MKKLFSLLHLKKVMVCFSVFLLCFCTLGAYAENAILTVDEIREQITSAWQSVYETNWRTIEIDILPTVPAVQRMPVLLVRPAYWIPSTDEDVLWTADGIHFDKGGDSFYLTSSVNSEEEKTKTSPAKTESISYYVYAPLDYDYPYAPANNLTMDEMMGALKYLMDTIDNDYFGLDLDHQLHIRISGDINKSTNEYLLPAKMTMDINMTLRGIPIYGHVIDSVASHKDSELWYNPHFTFSMRNQDSFSLMGNSVCEMEEIFADIPLCSFETIREALETEIVEGHIRAVYSIDLGYALYNVPGVQRKSGREWMKTAEFYAVPTWRCVCLYSNHAEKDISAETIADPFTSVYYKTLYVNAQTGQLINPNDNSKGCGDFQGIMTWAEVE